MLVVMNHLPSGAFIQIASGDSAVPALARPGRQKLARANFRSTVYGIGLAAAFLLVVAACADPAQDWQRGPASATSAPPSIPTPTLTSEEEVLRTPVQMPRSMMFTWWQWDREGLDLSLEVTLHNDPEPMPRGGLYLIGCTGFAIGGQGAYFGLQTDVNDPGRGGQGRGAIFSRWYDRNEARNVRVADTRASDGGWIESGDYEGNFVSVRNTYPWRAGTYRMELRAGELEAEHRWYEYWIVDDEGTETWMGSLRFPLPAMTHAACGTALEAYGQYLRPVDVPYWKVTVAPPVLDGVSARLDEVCYPQNVESLRNVIARYDDALGVVVYEVGLDYLAHDLSRSVCR